MSKKFAVIGYPLGHTLSPALHNEIFRIKGLPYSYEAVELSPDSLEKEFPQLLAKYFGFNCTIPFKQRVIPMTDRLSREAELLGSVNTIKSGECVWGYNTDADGFLKSIEANGIDLPGKSVLILGCGGVARAIAITCASLGCRLAIAGRDLEKAAGLSKEIASAGMDMPDYCEFNDIKGPFDLLVQCTPVGMTPLVNACVVKDEVIKDCDAVFDTVYNPLKTQLIKKAEGYGKKAISGLEMLVFQALASEELWLGLSFSPEEISHLINFTLSKLKEL